jgi:hypothetical protein
VSNGFGVTGNSEIDDAGVDICDRPPQTYGEFASHVHATCASIVDLAPGKHSQSARRLRRAPARRRFIDSLKSLYASMSAIVGWVYFDAIGPHGAWRVEPGTAQFEAFRSALGRNGAAATNVETPMR